MCQFSMKLKDPWATTIIQATIKLPSYRGHCQGIVIVANAFPKSLSSVIWIREKVIELEGLGEARGGRSCHYNSMCQIWDFFEKNWRGARPSNEVLYRMGTLCQSLQGHVQAKWGQKGSAL